MDRRRVAQEAEIINNLLDGYNPEVRPSGSVLYEGYHRPVVVTVNMYIRSIRKVDDAEMQYDVDVTLRQKWRDDRLSYAKEGPDSITLKDPHKIWTPDSFFANEYEGQRHMLDQPNTLVRISRDGSVFYSTRLSLALTCAMDFAVLFLNLKNIDSTVDFWNK
ncbi:unnamed protein product [Anisakis simplex]|uniref:GluClalpha (inferred by orthology to a D. melanogaster protein) n=1 Tax=Anisakis simplex TaxID=6269 RepID=A0A158PN52_ANISI|nr:unnamed protein product [Anisakis simplex]